MSGSSRSESLAEFWAQLRARLRPRSDQRRALISGASWDAWRERFPSLGGVSGGVSRDHAMKLGAAWACVSLIAGTLASLPMRVRVPKDSSATVDDDLIWLIEHEPHIDHARVTMWESLYARILLEGNAYCVIERNASGSPRALRPILEGAAEPLRMTEDQRRVFYRVTEFGEVQGYDPADVLHLKGSPMSDGLKALSPIQCLAHAFRIGISADEYAARFFSQGGQPPGYISYQTGSVSEQQIEEVRRGWTETFQRPEGAHRIAVLMDGGEFKSLALDPETAQLFQTRTAQAIDIARIYGVPPHLIGETDRSTSWGTGIEAQTTQFYTLALRRHVERIENELVRRLLTRAQRQAGIRIEMDLSAILRADEGARAVNHQRALGGAQGHGWVSVNEVRVDEGLPPLGPEYDQPYRAVPRDPAAAAGEALAFRSTRANMTKEGADNAA